MIFVRARLLNASLQVLPKIEKTRAIGREVVLNASEHREVFDTRIPAGGQWVWRYRIAKEERAQFLDVHIIIAKRVPFLQVARVLQLWGLRWVLFAVFESFKRVLCDFLSYANRLDSCNHDSGNTAVR